MILEVTRLLEAWLKDPSYGVAATLPTVERLRPDGKWDDIPKVPDIYSDMSNRAVAAEIDPPTAPALVLYCDSVARSDTKKDLRQISEGVMVVIAYITRDTDPLKAVVDGSYVARAVKKSLTLYNDQRLSYGKRELNGIKIAAIDQVVLERVSGAVGKSQLWGFTAAEVIAIDTQP